MSGVLGRRPCPVDLHLHTGVSDGDDTPEELADHCARAGITVAAVTDHDSMAGTAGFAAAARGRFTTVPGCEVTTTLDGTEVHCLAYWADGQEFAERIGRVRAAELTWWRTWVARVADYGVPLTWDQVETELGRGRIGYVGDYLALLLRAAGPDPRFAGYANDTRRLVAELCSPAGPLHVPHPWVPDIAEVAAWVASAGGVAVLAHPGHNRVDELDQRLARRLRDLGIAGMEVWTTWHTPRQSARLAELCSRTGLVATAGSDYHGTRVKPWSRAPGLLPQSPDHPMAIVEALHTRHENGS